MNHSYALGGFGHARHKRALADALTAMTGRGRGRGQRDRAFFDLPFGHGFPFGPGGPMGRGHKARRGDIRTAMLLLLAEEPRNGYQIMQEVEERSGGMWRPSPGSVYPALQQLEEASKVMAETRRSLYRILAEGDDA